MPSQTARFLLQSASYNGLGNAPRMNVLAYVYLRNIVGSTGAGRVARELVEHVSQYDDINLHVLGDRGDYRKIASQVTPQWAALPHHLFSMDTSYQQRKWFVFHTPSAEHFWPEVQIVHCMAESYVPASRSRRIVTVHDAAYFDHGAHPPNLTTWSQEMRWQVLFRTLSRTADVFHTVSQFSADRLAEAFPSIRSRLRVIHNGVAPFFFEPPGADLEQILQQTGVSGRRYILLPGGLHYRKNADLVLNAWPAVKARIPDLTLVVAGHNDPAYLRRASRMGSSMILAGFVEDQQLRALYHAAEAVWFPSRYEGFGLPVIEAMASGAAVVASNSTSIPEVAGDAALLVSPHSQGENIDAIQILLSDERLRQSLRERGRKRAASFTWDAAARQLHDLYAELL